jgi:hypothetical protein
MRKRHTSEETARGIAEVLVAAGLVVLLVGVYPFLLIAGANLLGVPLPYTWTTWFGALLVIVALRGGH